jgi:predicted transcriptional regulator
MAYMTKMTRRKVELLAEIERSPSMSIYQLARQCDRNYRRVFDQVKDLADAGLVNIRSTVRNGRQVSMVESIYHRRLQRLDDMYAFKVEIDAAQ